jgi:hypothetical protein
LAPPEQSETEGEEETEEEEEAVPFEEFINPLDQASFLALEACRGHVPPLVPGARRSLPMRPCCVPSACPGCHLFSSANYYGSLLVNHPPPEPGELPYLVNGWQKPRWMTPHSP